MLPKKRITAAFIVMATAVVAATATVGTDSHTGSHLAAPAAYMDVGGNNFQNVFPTKYTDINFGITSDKDKERVPSFAAFSDSGSAASISDSKGKSQAAASKKQRSSATSSFVGSLKRTSSQSTSSHAATTFFHLTAAQRNKIERVVMASCGELDDRLMAKANAQVILDRVKSGRFGKGINAVLDAPHQFETPWKGSINALVKNAVAAVFDRGERVTKVRIYYYENPNLKEVSTAVWCRDKRYVKTIGHGTYIHEYWTDKTNSK